MYSQYFNPDAMLEYAEASILTSVLCQNMYSWYITSDATSDYV